MKWDTTANYETRPIHFRIQFDSFMKLYGIQHTQAHHLSTIDSCCAVALLDFDVPATESNLQHIKVGHSVDLLIHFSLSSALTSPPDTPISSYWRDTKIKWIPTRNGTEKEIEFVMIHIPFRSISKENPGKFTLFVATLRHRPFCLNLDSFLNGRAKVEKRSTESIGSPQWHQRIYWAFSGESLMSLHFIPPFFLSTNLIRKLNKESCGEGKLQNNYSNLLLWFINEQFRWESYTSWTVIANILNLDFDPS